MPNLVTITDVSLGTIMDERDKFLAERETYRLKYLKAMMELDRVRQRLEELTATIKSD